ncbi:ROK family protein [Patescibacteria group bacterium]|nr:ROK family protein [Patescibacteria group bacterium]
MYLTADFGATNTRVASSNDLKSILKIKKFETSPDFNEQVKILNDTFEKLSKGEKIEGICVGSAGTLDQKEKKFLRTVNYGVKDGKYFDDLLDERFKDIPLCVENDASLAGLGEAVFGAGKSFDTVAYLTLSTGVGGVRVDKSKDKINYFPAEPGHHIILEDGRLHQRSGLFGSMESYVSGISFEEIFGVDPEFCEDEEAWDIYAKHLSTGLLNVIALWNPEVIVLGGGVSNQFDRFIEPLMKYLGKQDFFKIPEIKESKLGDRAGIYGGFVHLKNCL